MFYNTICTYISKDLWFIDIKNYKKYSIFNVSDYNSYKASPSMIKILKNEIIHHKYSEDLNNSKEIHLQPFLRNFYNTYSLFK